VAANIDDLAYRKGREEGFVWACEFATPDELRNLVENSSRPGRRGDPYWYGFVAGATEALDDAGPI
jgi:hypothetical protein